ncbi:hypothetical protein ACFW3E_39845, partial [Streptomyces sp. NPDC058861]
RDTHPRSRAPLAARQPHATPGPLAAEVLGSGYRMSGPDTFFLCEYECECRCEYLRACGQQLAPPA